MPKLLKRKLVIAWLDFSTFAKLALVFALGLAVITVASNITVFKLHFEQLNQSALGKIEQNIKLAASDLSLRAGFTGSIITHLSKLASLTFTQNDFESILLDSFESELAHQSLAQQLSYYSLSDDEVIALSRYPDQLIQSFDTQYIAMLTAEERGNMVVSPVDKDTGTFHLGKLVYNQKNEMIGAIIITRNAMDFFPEKENATKQTKTSKAVVTGTGEYLWKYENYKQKHPNSSALKEDFPDLQERVLSETSGAIPYNDTIIAFSKITVPFIKFDIVIIEELEFHTLLQTTAALKSTLWGMSLGYLGVLGVIFLYTANLIGVEIKFREAVSKEKEEVKSLSGD